MSSTIVRIAAAAIFAAGFPALLPLLAQDASSPTEAIVAYTNAWVDENDYAFTEVPTLYLGRQPRFEGVIENSDGVEGEVDMVFSSDGTVLMREATEFADGSFRRVNCGVSGTCILRLQDADGTLREITTKNGVVVRTEIQYPGGRVEVYVALADGSLVPDEAGKLASASFPAGAANAGNPGGQGQGNGKANKP